MLHVSWEVARVLQRVYGLAFSRPEVFKRKKLGYGHNVEASLNH